MAIDYKTLAFWASLFLITISGIAQSVERDSTKLQTKKIISAVEFNVGPSHLYPQELYESALRSQQQKYGYVITVNGIVPLTQRFDVSVDLSFERKGFKRSSFNDDRTIVLTGSVNNDYIVFTLLPRLNIKDRFFFGGGVYWAYLANSKSSFYLTNNGVAQSYTNPFEVSYAKSDWGFNAMIGCSFFLKKTLLNIHLINSNGQRIVNKTPMASVTSYRNNNSLSLLVGLTLNR